MALITVKDYAEERGISVQAVYKKLHKNEKKLKGHVRKKSGRLCLDSFAQQILDGKFPQEVPKMNPQEQILALQGELDQQEKELQRLRKILWDTIQEKNELTEKVAEINSKSSKSFIGRFFDRK